MDRLPLVRRLYNKEKCFSWIVENKALALICTEVFNFSVHGITNPASTMFALGSTVFNSIMIFAILPFRQWKIEQERPKRGIRPNRAERKRAA